MKRALSGLSRNMLQGLGRILQEWAADGIDEAIVHGGLLSGQSTLQSIYAESATQNCVLGTKYWEKETGRMFVYSQAGAVALSKGLMTQSAVAVANYVDEVQTGYGWSVGDTSGTVLITTGATPAANLFADGWMVCNLGTGITEMYPILTSGSHATIIAVTLKSGHPIRVAITVTDEITLLMNRYKKTIVVPVTTPTAGFAGVPVIDVTANYFYWSQVQGPCAMIVDTGDTVVIGKPAGVPATNAVPGAIGARVSTAHHYGIVDMIGAGDEVAVVNLQLAA